MAEGRAAVYHFTNGSQKRPIVYQKELERIKAYAHSIGFDNMDVFVDRTLKKSGRKQMDALMGQISSYSALILKDFYHMSKNTGACMSCLMHLSKAGIGVHTVEDGSFCFEQAPFGQPLRAAIYYCGLEAGDRSLDLQYEIMELFVKTKTEWKLSGKFADMMGSRTDDNQKELQRLIGERDRYDIVFVQSFGDISWRTSRFCKCRHLIQRGIYGMHEEMFLPYGKDG